MTPSFNRIMCKNPACACFVVHRAGFTLKSCDGRWIQGSMTLRSGDSVGFAAIIADKPSIDFGLNRGRIIKFEFCNLPKTWFICYNTKASSDYKRFVLDRPVIPNFDGGWDFEGGFTPTPSSLRPSTSCSPRWGMRRA